MSKGGFDRRGARQGERASANETTSHEQQEIAPGKAMRTSQLEPSRGQVVQRKTQAAAPHGRVRPIHEWMYDPDILAAHGHIAEAERIRAERQRNEAHEQAEPDARDERSVGVVDGAAQAPVQRKPIAVGSEPEETPGTPTHSNAGATPASAGAGRTSGHGMPVDVQAKGAAGAAAAGMDHASHAPVPTSISSPSTIQAKPADEAPLWENAEKDAAALLEAFQGLGTTEQVVYRVLGQPPEVVKAIVGVYNARYNRHTGQGLVEDLRAEFDELGGQADWHFVIGQLTRAGIGVPDAALRYERQDPAAEVDHQGGARIVATPNVRVAVPGTRITYALVHGTQSLHSLSSPYRYQWYVLGDPVTARMHGKPARVEGGDASQAEATARFVGNHKVICKVTPRTGRGAGVPAFYEFPQTVVPEGTLAQDALKHVPEAVDPARQLAVLETFLQVLRDAEQQPGSAPLDPKTAAAYEQQIAALRKRLASTEGAERIPIQVVHVDREKARVSPLRAFVARIQGGEPGEQETWRLVDITNPESRRLSGEHEGTGKDARAAIFAALAAWNGGNRYPTGRIQLEVGAEAAGTPIAHTFQTDGMSFWDSISEFFAEVGFWTGMGALAAGVVTAVTPVPGMRIVSGLVWASILASSASAVINITQRHVEGMSSTREDAMDVLTIAGNILAGTWMRGARVLVNGQGGTHGATKLGTGLLIGGQLGTDTAQGIVLGIEYLEQYERVMAIEDPEQRTDALMELLRSAALAGGMLFLSVQGTKSDLGRLGKPDGQPHPHRFGANEEAMGTAEPISGRASTGRIHDGGQSSQANAARIQEGESSDAAAQPEQAQARGAGPKAPPPAGLRAELAALREQLISPEAIAQFDRRYQSITKGKPAPTEVELGRFQRYLESKGRTSAEIEAGLAAEWARHHPRAKPPTGDAVDQLPGLRELANRVVRRLEDAKTARPELTQGFDRLLERLRAQDKILARMERGQLAANHEGSYNIRGLRNNIESAEAELDAALRDPHAVDLSRELKLGDKEIEIDRITNSGDRWVDVKNYELFGERSSNMRTLMEQANKALRLAEANPNPATGKIPEVVYEFAKGITPEARKMLETVRVNGRGITVIGKVTPLSRRTQGAMPQGNLDGEEL